MLTAIRRYLTYANVAATIAVVLGMTGGAYAMGSGSSQRSHSVPAAAAAKKAKGKGKGASKGARGPRGPKGEQGPEGKQGPAGPAGPAGARGEVGATGGSGGNGVNGKSVVVGAATASECPTGGSTFEVEGSGTKSKTCNGQKGAPGAEGSPWTAGGTLPEGATETGEWSFGLEPAGAENVKASVSFSIPLAGKECEVEPGVTVEQGLCANQTHFVSLEEQEEEKVPAACTVEGVEGSMSKPLATSDNLCVYEGANFFEGSVEIQSSRQEFAGADVSGAILFFLGAEQYGNAGGSFAVTG